jgi:hypothetical protein
MSHNPSLAFYVKKKNSLIVEENDLTMKVSHYLAHSPIVDISIT